LANATNFYNLQAQYNIYGIQDVQSVIGGSIEGSCRSGARYVRVGGSLHDVWFEANCLLQKANTTNREVEAHIWANASETFDDANWRPVSIAISGNMKFGTPFDEAMQSYVLAGCMNLSISGVAYIPTQAPPRYHLHPNSRVVDTSVGAHLMDAAIGGGPAATGPFHYARPTWIDNFDGSKNWWSTK
jgi:hypothetical protein